MRIAVSDSSCLIDLRKASLLGALLQLPYEFVIPDILFDEELLEFASAEKEGLIRAGLRVLDLPGNGVKRAVELIGAKPKLSIHDGFAFVLAESYPGCILLTGDGELRALADSQKIEVHGVLWVLDELHRCRLATAATLAAALRTFAADPTVRLPYRELAAYTKRYETLK